MKNITRRQNVSRKGHSPTGHSEYALFIGERNKTLAPHQENGTRIIYRASPAEKSDRMYS